MALVRGSRASPNERLSQAISKFAGELSPEQRCQLQENRSQPPSMDDVMSLTAEIDLQSTNQITEFRRCYGPRITNFLDGIQEFAKVADIAVGSAKNSVASGVWTAVRFLLLAGTHAPNPYVDKLSALFLNFGRSAHRFRDMAILFPRSQNLRDAVFEYYILVVDMCCEILRLSKKTNLARYWTAFAEETYTAKLDRCAKQIMQELELESNRVAAEESRKNSIFRARSTQHMLLQKHHRGRVLKKRLLDACSKHDYKTTWKQTRDLGTTLLFNNSEAYQEWKQSRKSCTLLYYGKLGSGKSVLLANIVGDLYLQPNPPRQIVYFFCRHDLSDSLFPRTVFGCIARQLLQHHSELEELASSTAFESQLSIDDTLELIKRSSVLPIYLVLDGIDNCRPEHREEILQNLRHLQQHLVFNICISTRESSNQVQNREAPWQYLLTASLPEQNPDLESYIEYEIDKRLKSGKLIINDTSLITKVKTNLRSKADGMFLWVHLQIVCLCLMETDHDIEQSLESLPRDLSETYSRLLQNQATSRYRAPLFELIVAAREPLTTSQLREALSIEAGNTQFNPAKLLNSIDRVIKTSAGLVVVDEQEDTVRFVHHSAVDFLTSSGYESQINLKQASTRMTHNILTYLNYSLLETQLTLREPPTLNTEAIPAAILMSMLPGGRKIVKPTRARNLDKKLAEYAQPALVKRNHFMSYAQSYWLFHVLDTQLGMDYLSLLNSALGKGRMPLSALHTSGTPLQQSVIAMRLDLVTLFLASNPDNDDKEKSLQLAILQECKFYIFYHVLDDSDIEDILRPSTQEDRMSAIIDLLVGNCLHLTEDQMLVLAIQHDSPVAWQAILKYYTKIDAKSLNRQYMIHGSWQTPLRGSIYPKSRYEVSRMSKVLLSDARVDPLRKSYGKTLMVHAIENGYVMVVQLLSKHYHHQVIGPEMEREIWSACLHDAPFFHPRTSAAENVEILLSAHCLTLRCYLDPDRHITPLMEACKLARLDIIRVMLKYDCGNINDRSRIKNADYNRRRRKGIPASKYFPDRTAWDFAGRSDVKELLEEYGGKGCGDLVLGAVQLSKSSEASNPDKEETL